MQIGPINFCGCVLSTAASVHPPGGGTSDGIFRITRYTIEKNAGDIKTSQQLTAAAQTAARYIGMMMYSK
jgi:hypothetical protein